MENVSPKKTGYERFSFTNSYKISKLLGSGAYGKVFKGTAPNGTTVALKEIVLEATHEGIPLSTLRELSVLKKVQSYNSSHLVQMLDISLTKKNNKLHIYIVFEFIECDLHQFLTNHVPPTGLPPDTVRDLAEQLLRGTDFLHSHRIIHRDLKPANILIDLEGRQLKIADFGLSRVLGWESKLTPVVVTLWYRAPEILLQSEYLSPCDIWAAGCIIAELFNCAALFQADNELKLLDKIFNVLGFPDEVDWPVHSHLKRKDFKIPSHTKSNLRNSIRTTDTTALDLLERLIHFNPKKRIPAYEALSMPYFHPRPNTFPGLPFHSRSAVGLSSMVDGCATGSTLLARPHRHSVIPSHSVQSFAIPTVAGTTAPHSIQLDQFKPSHRPVVCGATELHPLIMSTSHGGVNVSEPIARTIHQPSCSHTPSVLQPVRTTLVSDLEQHQQNLMISVVKHAIDEAQTPSPSCSGSKKPPLPKAPSLPQRPVTRQQTRATRRHTQPTVPSSSSVIQPTTNLSRAMVRTGSSRISGLLVSTDPQQLATLTGPVTRDQTSSSSEVNATRGGRQRKTARRRTITGVGNRNSKTQMVGKEAQLVNLGNRPEHVFTIGSSGPATTDSTQTGLSLASSSEHPQPEFLVPPQSQNYHRRLTRLLDQHQLKSSHSQQQIPRSNFYRPGRYSMEPSLSSHVLMPISEQRLATELTPTILDHMEDVKQFPEPLDESPVHEAGTDENTLCSPSKQPRVFVLSQSTEQPRSKHNTPSNWSILTDFSDQSVVADEDDVAGGTDTEDSDTHVANTSLGINSAMTGLALVHRNSSSASNKTTGGL